MGNEADKKQNQKDVEQNLGYSSRGKGDDSKAKNAGDQSDKEKD